MESPTNSTSENRARSPQKKRNPNKTNNRRLQLYNPSHKKELVKLFSQIKVFKLYERDDHDKLTDTQLQLEASDDEDEICTEMRLDTVSKNEDLLKSGKLSCSTCGISVEVLTDLRSHYRLDWHRCNVKRKLHGQTAITETQFNEMIDDLSSIEGSDSEDESQNDNNATAVSRLLEKVAIKPDSKDKTNFEKAAELEREKAFAASPKGYFENGAGQLFGLYNSVFEAVNVRPIADLSSKFQNILEDPLKIAVIMISGGHFAAAVFHGNETVLHKTFHSYTVRAKQGGSQGSNDSKSGTSHAKSAGASLRRYNEQSFRQHVQDLMESWRSKLSECGVIFYRAVSSSANVLFGGKIPPLQKSDARLFNVPFQTRRPTLMEVKRVFSLLTVLHIYENQSQFIAEHQPRSKKSKANSRKKEIDRAKSRSPKRHENPVALISQHNSEPEVLNASEEELELTDIEIDLTELKEYDNSLNPEDIMTKRKRTKPKKSKPVVDPFPKPTGVVGMLLDALISTKAEEIEKAVEDVRLTSERIGSDFSQEINQPIDFDESNLLHLASERNYLDVIWKLLECGCDPATKNKSGKYPYNLAETKDSRAVFRRFMGQFPDQYDYKQAQVPAPLTEEIEAEKAEKKKMLNKLKREKEKEKRRIKMEKEKELNDKEKYLKLSDREKRAIAAEQRILAQCKRNGEQLPVLVRCFECACDMTGKIPFEYNHNVFCTTTCLTQHRKKFPVPLSV